jgi:hypothetical protein
LILPRLLAQGNYACEGGTLPISEVGFSEPSSFSLPFQFLNPDGVFRKPPEFFPGIAVFFSNLFSYLFRLNVELF